MHSFIEDVFTSSNLHFELKLFSFNGENISESSSFAIPDIAFAMLKQKRSISMNVQLSVNLGSKPMFISSLCQTNSQNTGVTDTLHTVCPFRATAFILIIAH